MNRLLVNRVFGAIAFAGVMTAGGAMAAGPYDGQWNAHTSFAQRKCTNGEFSVTVADNKLTGMWKGVRGTYDVSGTIAPDGTFEGMIGKGRFTGKFSGDSFNGTFPPPEAACGEGHVQFERAK